MLKTDKIIVVEGRYDKIKLSSLLDAVIITTDGFGIYKDKEKTLTISNFFPLSFKIVYISKKLS